MSRVKLPVRHVLRSCGLALVILAASTLSPAPAVTVQAAAPVRLRLGVVNDGIVVVSPADLTAAGINPDTVNPQTFALSSLGTPVAILVTGESDGRFDANDRLYFFGQRYRSNQQDEKYTDERVYWLEAGGAAGPRIQTVGASAHGGLTPPESFAATLRAEESLQWWTLHTVNLDTKDTWFWARLTPVGADTSVSAELPYMVPDPAPGTTATLSMEVISRAGRTGLNPDHRTSAQLSGKTIFDRTWDAIRVRRVFSGTVPADTLVDGVNTVTVSTWALSDNNASTTDVDDVYVNYWQLDYRRLFRAHEGRLDFRAEQSGAQEYAVGGWDTNDVMIWNISSADVPVQLSPLQESLPHRLLLPLVTLAGGTATPHGAADLTVRFRATAPAGSRYWLQDRNTAQPPHSIAVRGDTGLRAPVGGADAVIVTSAELRPAAERLAQWHRDQGRRTLVVDIRDAYDEFEAGIALPQAIQKMMAWGVANWTAPAPAFLTLVGDGHWNFKGYNTAIYPNPPNHIPPYLSWVDPWQGEVPTDNRFGDIDDNGRPEIAVGRLAVNTLAEANTVVDKILGYDQGVRSADWQTKALFVSDNPDSAGNFPAASDEIINAYTPANLQPIKAYLPGSPPSIPATAEQIATTRDTIFSAIQSGVWMIQYNGHGAPDRWTHESVWRGSDIAALANGNKLPFVMTFNCLDGYFVHPVVANYSLAELIQRQAGGGAIAAFSPTGLGTTSEQQAFRKMLLDTMFKDNVREMGSALLIAKQKYYAVYGRHYLIETMTLFGDPALRLPAGVN